MSHAALASEASICLLLWARRGHGRASGGEKGRWSHRAALLHRSTRSCLFAQSVFHCLLLKRLLCAVPVTGWLSAVWTGRHQSKCSFLEGLPPLQKPACEPCYIAIPRTLRIAQASLVRFARYTQFGRPACLFDLRHVTRTRLHHLQRDWNPSAYSAFRDD